MCIEVEIKKRLGGFTLEVEFQSKSRRIGILGASGCGKSLTLKSIAGIEQPKQGRIAVNGRVLLDTKKRVNLKPQVRRAGYLFQNYALFPTMTVEENIGAGIKEKGEDRRKKIRGMIERFQLEGLEKRLPGELSGGQQQRTALARILVCEPEMILLDEPFSALDVYLKDQMQRELMEMLKEYEGTVLLVSHSRDEIYRMSEEVLIMDTGRIAGQGKTREIFENPRKKVTARLTGCKNIADVREDGESGLIAPAWGLKLPIKTKNIQGVKAAAIRAHEFTAEKTEEALCFPVLNPLVTEDMFEYNISFQTAPDAEKRLDWKVSKYLWKYNGHNIPTRLYLKEKNLLFLYG